MKLFSNCQSTAAVNAWKRLKYLQETLTADVDTHETNSWASSPSSWDRKNT